MATRNNQYGLRVKLDTEQKAVNVQVIDKKANDGDGAVFEEENFFASQIAEGLHTNVALYGLSKLLQDRSSDVKAGPGKLTAMREIATQLSNGEWERERKVGAIVVRPEVEALAEIKGVSVAEIQRALQKYPKDAKERILSNEDVVAKAQQIRAAREASEDTEIDLSEFGVEDDAA